MEESVDDPTEKKQNSLNIYQYDAHLALAFQADCEELFSKFSQIKSYSFSDFANLWKKTCFISIFGDQDYILMLQVFIENCFVVVKKFLFFSDPYYQLGAVFTLYALYYKQPIKEWVKIRLTQDETDKLNEIIHFHKRNDRLEVAFVVSKMRLDGAFQYCALVQPMGLHAKFTKRVDFGGEEVNNRKTSIERNPLRKFKNLMENDPILKDIEETDQEYQLLADKYKEKCNQLHIFPSDIVEDIRVTYRQTIEDLSSERNEDQSTLCDVKTRAMTNKNATYRGESSRVTAMDLDISFSE